jgi:hypothetical protein
MKVWDKFCVLALFFILVKALCGIVLVNALELFDICSICCSSLQEVLEKFYLERSLGRDSRVIDRVLIGLHVDFLVC